MIQGCGSDVGKSVLVAGLCRLLANRGVDVAPFKPQNMALNSCITAEGAEMGRAQVVQAEAARLAPHVDMNPVLLKPTTDVGAQVILQGKVHSNMKAVQYHEFKHKAREVVFDSYNRLKSRHDLILIEGAGSPAEINLREGDIANMGFALEAKAPVLLVGDINKGGVFASLVGTLELIAPEEAQLIKGFIINKFRGDATLLDPAYEAISKRTGKPFLGTVPWYTDIFIQEEDGLHFDSAGDAEGTGTLRVAVVVARRMSNFTDFDPFLGEEGVVLDFVRPGGKIGDADIVILPGSKNTIDDLKTLREAGLADQVLAAHQRGASIIGICGGYQMLGKTVRDPDAVEGSIPEIAGLGLLDIETVMETDKVTALSRGVIERGALAWCADSEDSADSDELKGYEIHMGRTTLGGDATPLMKLRRLEGEEFHSDGAVSPDGRVAGTYLHGIFDNDNFRHALLAKHRGHHVQTQSFAAKKEEGYEKLAALLAECLDIEAILKIIERGA
jgi:adenosylcobyric acid synthase